jgi:hypothetical protein
VYIALHTDTATATAIEAVDTANNGKAHND